MAGELNPAAAAAAAAGVGSGSPTKNATTTITTTANPSLVPKRQRRPSVRLGDIGGDTFTRLPNLSLSKPSSSSSKSRPLTNLVHNHHNNNNHEADNHGTSFGRKSAKKPRTSFTRKDDDNNNNNNSNTEFDYEQLEDEEEEDPEQEHRSPLTVHSGDQGFFQGWTPHNSNLVSPGLDEGVRKWLLHLGLSRYSPVFQIHEVDDDVLPHLTLDDLKDMGITAVGSRRKLYAAILNLRKGLS